MGIASSPAGALLDATLTWIAAVGVVRYLVHVWRKEPSFLERRTLPLLACFAVALTVRGFAWLAPSRALSALVFVPVTLLPLATHLFVEGMLRRHLPLPMKILSSGVSLVFLGPA